MQAVSGTVGKALEPDTGSGRMQAAEIGDRMAGDREQAENPGVHMAACPVVLNGQAEARKLWGNIF